MIKRFTAKEARKTKKELIDNDNKIYNKVYNDFVNDLKYIPKNHNSPYLFIKNALVNDALRDPKNSPFFKLIFNIEKLDIKLLPNKRKKFKKKIKK